jgi:hypothetical protein
LNNEGYDRSIFEDLKPTAGLWSRQGEDNVLRWLYVLGQGREDRSVVVTGITTVDEYTNCIFNNLQTVALTD